MSLGVRIATIITSKAALRVSISTALIICATACARDAAPRRATADGSARRPTPPALTASAPAAAAADTAGCDAVPKQQFARPEELVREWVRRDTLGYFLAPDERLFELMECPGHLGGGDEVVVATDAVIHTVGAGADSAQFLITYRRYGVLHSDTSGTRTVFEPRPGADSVRVSVVRTGLGWRFPYDVTNPHLSPAVALREMHGEWDPASRDALSAIQPSGAPLTVGGANVIND